MQLARKHEAEETARAKLAFQPLCEVIRKDIPFTSWNGFLQIKADQGNETALAILRSKGETVEPDREPQTVPVKDWSQHGKEQFTVNRAKIRAEYAARERATLENDDMSDTAKKQLLAVLRMEQLAAEEARPESKAQIHGFSASVDRKGVVIFTLPGGGRILDSGKELFFQAITKPPIVLPSVMLRKNGESRSPWRGIKSSGGPRRKGREQWSDDSYFSAILSAIAFTSSPGRTPRAFASFKIIRKLGCFFPVSSL